MPRHHRLVPTALPSPSSRAEPASRLYVGHRARLSAGIPAHWTLDLDSGGVYGSDDGFVVSLPVDRQTLDEACISVATWQFETAARSDTTWSGAAAGRIDGRSGGRDASALVVPHPDPFTLDNEFFRFAAVICDPAHFDGITATLSFDPGRVTPDAYVSSVIDLVEAGAWWADRIDREAARLEIMRAIEGLPAAEMNGRAILALLGQLRAVGDNHSFAVLPEQANSFNENQLIGFGMLVGGSQVLAVYPDGPADRAGVRPGDMVDTLDGSPFTSDIPAMEVSDPARLGEFDPSRQTGETAIFTLRRVGVADPIAVTIEQGPYIAYRAPTGDRLDHDIGYIQVPDFGTPGQETAFASTANAIIAAADTPPACGWIVDLRLNFGGNYMPMVTGIGPILGNGTCVGWQTRDGHQTWIAYEDGRIVGNGYPIADILAGQPRHDLREANPPVAVLTGSFTSSSGEVTTLAFVGRPGARLFGEQTFGHTTSNVTCPLFDGTTLLLAVAAMIDRNGNTHMAGITPDDVVPTDWSTYGTDRDEVIRAAMTWLRQHPACASRSAGSDYAGGEATGVTTGDATGDATGVAGGPGSIP